MSLKDMRTLSTSDEKLPQMPALGEAGGGGGEEEEGTVEGRAAVEDGSAAAAALVGGGTTAAVSTPSALARLGRCRRAPRRALCSTPCLRTCAATARRAAWAAGHVAGRMAGRMRAGGAPGAQVSRPHCTRRAATRACTEVTAPSAGRAGRGATRPCVRQRLDLLALATAFRDLHASPVHAAADAHAIEGKPHDTAALRDAVAAWASLPLPSGYSSASLQIEDSLVRVHSWLRALLSAWKRSGEVVPLSSEAADKSRTGGQQPDELLLGADEQRIVLVELEAAPPAGEVAPSSSTSSAAAAVATKGVSGCNGAPSAAATTSGDAPSAESQRQRGGGGRDASIPRACARRRQWARERRQPHAERPAAAEATGTGGVGVGVGGVAAAADSESYRLRGDSSSLASQQRRALARTLHRKAKCEASISIELLGYDKSLRTAYEQRQARLFASRNAASAEAPTNEQKKQGIKSDGQELQPQMVRSLPVVGSVCVSRMEIGQRSINFGECESYTPVEKSIILHNRAATPLLYKIAKTGRHASFDVLIRAEDRRAAACGRTARARCASCSAHRSREPTARPSPSTTCRTRRMCRR